MVAGLSVNNLTLNEAVKGITVSEVVKGITVSEVVNSVQIDKQSDIPWIIRLLENPISPIALPGKISLANHDCIHVILGRGVTLQDEAFVIGFTMGSDVKTNWFHLGIFKFFSIFLYPKKFRFNREDLKVFDLGFAYGRKPGILKNINQIDFQLYQNKKIAELRKLFGISIDELRRLRQFENWLIS